MIVADHIIDIFSAAFFSRYRTLLKGGGSEPTYAPACYGEPAVITFREDFAASALHEVAHWCIAGAHRRSLPDYGYWYEAERDECSEARFMAAEASPQALEWIFSMAAARPFRISADNPHAPEDARNRLRGRVQSEARHWLARGLPQRAMTFAVGLGHASGMNATFFNAENFVNPPA